MSTFVEALNFVDDSVLKFVIIGGLVIIAYMLFMAWKQRPKAEEVVEAPQPELPIHEVPPLGSGPPPPSAPVIGIPVGTPVLPELEIANPIGTPVPPEVPELKEPVYNVDGPFADRAGLLQFIHDTDCQAAVNLDGVAVKGGFGPALSYYTHADGLIRRH